MKARNLIESSSFGPDALKALWQAFDEAWNSVAANYGSDQTAIEDARFRLATYMIALAASGVTEPEALKRAALQRLADSEKPVKLKKP